MDALRVPPMPPGIEKVTSALLATRRLCRYVEGTSKEDEAALLEADLARMHGRRFAVACHSGGAALFLALKSLGVGAGDRVLVSSYTLSPVPGAVVHAGASCVFVDTTRDLIVDTDHLRALLSNAPPRTYKAFLLSYMRGHLPDLETVGTLCDEHGVALVEDAAHALGARVHGRRIGTEGTVSCFSFQAYKHVNAGEGGALVTDEEDVAARAILLSGSYGFYAKHLARPSDATFRKWIPWTPNCSMRMSCLTAALVRAQLPLLEGRVVRWRDACRDMQAALCASFGDKVSFPTPLEGTVPAPSSVQFYLAEPPCCDLVPGLKWVGDPEPKGFSACMELSDDAVRRFDEHAATLFDLRVPYDLTPEEAEVVAERVYSACHK